MAKGKRWECYQLIMNQDITQKELKEFLSYDSNTGVFIWKVSRGKASPGKIAGCLDAYGYSRIKIRGKDYKAHRLAWLYVYGVWPEAQIDHINHNESDNRIKNLRDVDSFDNCRNRKFSSRNSSGHSGVIWHKNRWCVQITNMGKQIYGGVYKSLCHAISARKNLELKYDFHPNHGTNIS